MQTHQITIIAVSVVFSAILLAVGVMLMCGKGGRFVNGYNFKAKGEKALKYELYFLRKTGMFLFILTADLFVLLMMVAFNIKIGIFICTGIIVLITIIGLIYFNANRKIKRSVYLARKFTENPDYKDEFTEGDNF